MRMKDYIEKHKGDPKFKDAIARCETFMKHEPKPMIHRHHLLEIILWPMPDGSFKEIRNSADRLKELGIYKEFKMTIPLIAKEHMTLHHGKH